MAIKSKSRTRKKKITKDDLRKLWEDVNLHGKEPPEDESVWFLNPLVAFLFAKYKKGKPYSEELEKLFYGDVKAIYCYLHWIVSDLRLEIPEHLHNYMIAKSIEIGSDCKQSSGCYSGKHTEQEWVDLYFQNVLNKNKND